MAGRSEAFARGDCFRFFSREQVDQILREGAKHGRAGSHAAIERILKFEPAIERSDLWQRIRQLRYPADQKRICRAVWTVDEEELLRKGYANGWTGKKEVVRELLRRHPDWQPHLIWKRASQLGLVQRNVKRHQERSQHPWSEHDDRVLLNLAGYKEVGVIAKMLHRSENAVRSRLSVLGKSSRTHKEGYAQRALSEELHLGSRTIRKLIAGGFLEVRDPRITRQSLKSINVHTTSVPVVGDPSDPATISCAEASFSVAKNGDGGELSVANPNVIGPRPARSSRADRVWRETATQVGLSLQTIKNYIARGVLKLYDPRVTERSLRNLCRRYGSLINSDYLNRETRDWLESSLDFTGKGGEALARQLASRRKHAQVVRRCSACTREIRGNAFFRHSKNCDQAENSSRSGAVAG